MLLCPGAIKNTTQIAYWNVSSLFSPHDKIFLSSAPFCCIGTTVMGQHTFVYLYPFDCSRLPLSSKTNQNTFDILLHEILSHCEQLNGFLSTKVKYHCHQFFFKFMPWIRAFVSKFIRANSSRTLEKMLQKLHHKISFAPATW